MRHEILIVDGYNMIGDWPDLVVFHKQNAIEEARDRLLSRLSNYVAYHGIEAWVVFDAQLVSGLSKSYKQYNLNVVFTAEGQTADSYIEGMIKNMTSVLNNVTVATSDLAEQRVIFRQGAIRKSARELWRDVESTDQQIRSGDAHDMTTNYQPKFPWSYLQLQQLKNLLNELSQDKEDHPKV